MRTCSVGLGSQVEQVAEGLIHADGWNSRLLLWGAEVPKQAEGGHVLIAIPCRCCLRRNHGRCLPLGPYMLKRCHRWQSRPPYCCWSCRCCRCRSRSAPRRRRWLLCGPGQQHLCKRGCRLQQLRIQRLQLGHPRQARASGPAALLRGRACGCRLGDCPRRCNQHLQAHGRALGAGCVICSCPSCRWALMRLLPVG